MNDDQERDRTELPEGRPETAESAEAHRSSMFAVHRNPSLAAAAGDRGSRVGRGIAWVRPTDLIPSSSARVAGRGIDLHTELAHRVRRAPGHAYRATRKGVRDFRDRRAGRVAPEGSSVFESFEAFDLQDRPRSSSWVRPSGIGLG